MCAGSLEAAQEAVGSLMWRCVLLVCERGRVSWQSKDSALLSPMSRLLPQRDSQTWTAQGVAASRVSQSWLTPTAGALCSSSGSQMGHVLFPLRQEESHFFFFFSFFYSVNAMLSFLCHISPLLKTTFGFLLSACLSVAFLYAWIGGKLFLKFFFFT